MCLCKTRERAECRVVCLGVEVTKAYKRENTLPCKLSCLA